MLSGVRGTKGQTHWPVLLPCEKTNRWKHADIINNLKNIVRVVDTGKLVDIEIEAV